MYHFEPNPFNLSKHASSVCNMISVKANIESISNSTLMISVKANIESINNSTLTIDPTHSSSPLSTHQSNPCCYYYYSDLLLLHTHS